MFQCSKIKILNLILYLSLEELKQNWNGLVQTQFQAKCEMNQKKIKWGNIDSTRNWDYVEN